MIVMFCYHLLHNGSSVPVNTSVITCSLWPIGGVSALWVRATEGSWKARRFGQSSGRPWWWAAWDLLHFPGNLSSLSSLLILGVHRNIQPQKQYHRVEEWQLRNAVLSSITGLFHFVCEFMFDCMQYKRCSGRKKVGKSAASDGHEIQFGLRD